MVKTLYNEIVKRTLDEFLNGVKLDISDQSLLELCKSLSELFSQIVEIEQLEEYNNASERITT